MRPASYSVAQDIGATFVRVLAYMGGLAILAITAASFSRTPAGVAATDPSPRPQWTKVERPYPAFELLNALNLRAAGPTMRSCAAPPTAPARTC